MKESEIMFLKNKVNDYEQSIVSMKEDRKIEIIQISVRFY